MSDPLVSVRGVGLHLDDALILGDVTFDVHPGEFVALMGRNGAGKSSLLDIVAGLRAPTAGEVWCAGQPLSAWLPGQLARIRSHLPQIVRTDGAFSVEQFVMMGRYPHASGWFEADDDLMAVERTMAQFDCLQLRDRPMRTLSGGERQRVLIAACLAQQPQVLLLDEPGAFLDVDHQVHCFSVLREQAGAGTACVAVTHDLNLALTFCSRLVVLNGGRLVQDVAAARALDNPAWIDKLSSRLSATIAPAGRPWVWYR